MPITRDFQIIERNPADLQARIDYLQDLVDTLAGRGWMLEAELVVLQEENERLQAKVKALEFARWVATETAIRIMEEQ